MANYKLMPVEPTLEMLTAGEYALEAGCYVSGIYADMRAAAPAVQGEPVAITKADHVKGETGYCEYLCNLPHGTRLYLSTQPAEQQPDVTHLVEVPYYINDAIDNLAHDNYGVSHGGSLERTRDVELIRAYVARTGQPAEQQPISINKVRVEFEAWMASQGLESEWQPERNAYKDFVAHFAYQAYQASRAAHRKGGES